MMDARIEYPFGRRPQEYSIRAVFVHYHEKMLCRITKNSTYFSSIFMKSKIC